MRKMKKHRVFVFSCLLFLCILNKTKAQGNFEDADELSDLTGGNSGQHFDLRHTIPGIPEVDYPIYSRVPKTSFECTGRHEGYYADIESRCQAFRICTHTARSKQGFGFLCPNGTLFNQKYFVCDWYRNVDCDDSEHFYSKNDINRVGSNFDMMETVRQIMEYPMKTISKALQQNPGSSRKPTQINREVSKGTPSAVDMNKESETVRSRGRTGSSRKSVTRDQVESAQNRGSTKYIREKDINSNREKEETSEIQDDVARVTINERKTSQGGSILSSNASDDVYVNSLGELSTDPGVTFDRTNAHIIAEPRRYRYEKYRLNFAEKVNAGLNDFIDLPVNESLAPDYVKTMRDANVDTPRIDLPSNINGLLDEIANDLNPNTSGYQVPKPSKAKHSFRFLSRGFSSQEDPYKYKKPKQTASTARFTLNQLPIAEEKAPKKPVSVIGHNAGSLGHSTKIPETSALPEPEDAIDYLLPPLEQQTFEEVPYLSPPALDPTESTTNMVATVDEGNTAAVPNAAQPQQEATSTTDLPTKAALIETTTAFPSTETLSSETSTVVSDIGHNLIASPQQDPKQKFDAEDTPIDEDRVDVNKQAENLFISGLQLTNNENNTEVTTAGTVPAHTPLLIQVAEDHSYLTAWITSTALPTSEVATTTTPDTQPELGSLQDRIRNYRRLANLQRASAKPLIYGKRAGLRMTKTITTSTTTPKPSSTTRSYLKRVAASRLRLSRLAAAAGNKQNLPTSATAPLLSPGDNEIDASNNKKLSIRNIDRDTGNAVNNIDESASVNNSGVVTWESVKNRLQRFQVKPTFESDVNTTISPKTTSTSNNSVSTRNTLLRKRSRVINIRSQQSSSNKNNSSYHESTNDPATSITSSTSVSVSSSPSSLSSLGKPSSLSFLNTVPHVVLPSSPSQPTLSLTSPSVQNDITSSISSSSNLFVNGATADNTNLNSNSASAPNNFISFDKLTRSIVDDSILQNYRGGPVLGRSSLASSVNNYQLSPASTSQNVFSQVSSSPPRSVAFTKLPEAVPSHLTPPQRPTQLPPLPAAIVPTTSGPRIVVAHAEGQRIEPNTVSSIISSLLTQQQKVQPKPTPSTSYVPLNDFLTKKFGNHAKNTINLPTSNDNNRQYHQQRQQYNQPQRQQAQIIYSQQQPQYHQNQAQHQQQQSSHQQYQQTKPIALQQYQQKQPQIHQSQQQPQFQSGPKQQQFSTFDQQQQKQNIYIQSGAPLALQQSAPQINYLQQNRPQTLLSHQSASQSPTPSLQPLVTQNIFESFKQQQQQLPVFPPLATQATPQSQVLQQFDGNNNYLNVQLPSLGNGLIPAPTNQIAQRRSDIALDDLELTDFTPAQSIFTGATSYDVPLNSIGRLSNDMQALFRRYRKY